MLQLLVRQTPIRQHLLRVASNQTVCQCGFAQQVKEESSSSSLATARERSDVSTDVKPLGEKIKENTKTASYMGIIVLGVGVTGALFYAIFRELFSSNSPNGVYSKALDRVIHEPRVQDAIGAPIKGYGEETRRGRRNHVAHSVFERNGVDHMRMQFYVQGIRNKATVHLEMRKVNGNYEYRYMFVQLDHYPRTTIILEDNRASDPGMSGSTKGLDSLISLPTMK